MPDGFARQRRNLMIISVFLLVFDFARLEISSVNLLGTELIIGRPEVLIMLAWTMWAYFLWRYYQYFKDSGLKHLVSSFLQMRDRVARPVLLRSVKRKEGKAIHDVEFRIQEGRSALSPFWDVTAVGLPLGPEYDQRSDRWTVNVSPLVIFWIHVKATIFLTFDTPVVTNYLMPFLVAFSALIVKTSVSF